MNMGEGFPLTQIDKGGVSTMMRQLGGDPVVPSQVEGLLEQSALPFFDQDKKLLHLFMMVGYGTLDAFGLPGDADLDAFCAGGYMYAASLARLTPLTEVPLHPAVSAAIGETDNHDFTSEAYRALYQDQAPIVGLISKVDQVFGLDVPHRRKMAIVGGGTLHLITKRSLLAAAFEEAFSIADHLEAGMGQVQGALFESNHPELHDLEAEFKKLDPEE